jgi:hypothetical protein
MALDGSSQWLLGHQGGLTPEEATTFVGGLML